MQAPKLSRFLHAILALALPLHALCDDQVTLANGDRVTGSIVAKETDVLVMQSPMFGELKIRWTDIVRIHSDKSVRLYLDDGTRMEGTLQTITDGTVVILSADTPPPAPVDLKRVVFINPAPDISGEGVKYLGRINLGFSSSSGNSDIETLYAETEIIARTRNNRYTLGGKTRRSKDNERESESNWLLGAKWDHFFTKRWYTYANTNFENDQFKDIRLRSTLGGGTGFQVFESPQTNLALEGGLTFINTDFFVGVDEEYPALRWALKFDHFLFATRTQFFHLHEAYTAIDNSDNAFVKTQTGLRFPVIGALSGTLQYNVDWENIPAPGRVRQDETILFTLGYVW